MRPLATPGTEGTRRHYRAVFISPHLDDAVFSCGGELARLAAEGPVLVVNVFTRFPSEVRRRSVVVGPERSGEEAAAARFLQFESWCLDELDATFRQPAYRSLGNLFRPPVDADVRDFLPHLRRRLDELLAGLDFDRLYVPLGVGWHVDHVLVHRALVPWCERTDVRFYEDAPYCLLPHATRLRLEELGLASGAPSDASLAPAGALAAWWRAARAYAATPMMRRLEPWPVRWLAVPVVSAYLFRLLARRRREARARPGRWTLQATTTPLSGPAFARKVQAAALYASQFAEFFFDAADCERLHLAYARQMQPRSGPVERVWRRCAEA